MTLKALARAMFDRMGWDGDRLKMERKTGRGWLGDWLRTAAAVFIGRRLFMTADLARRSGHGRCIDVSLRI